ncbi:TetR family transcriptional regulator [Amycolatopsis ultiminotia]|uniref:TetR family transcriptional regulator n=1 Tax=Amycolatopsis ultiminotia TaxID=543629 RepID=A0ABP6V574_9PSEU
MRADARANHDRLLAVAGAVITEQGVDASMRDIARQAGVGLATLLRHFPAREALLEALLRTNFDELTARAAEVESTSPPGDALRLWLRDFVTCTANYRGVVTSMMQAIEDPESALHNSCVTMRAAGTRLLSRAQDANLARADLDGADLFALASALTWLGDQPGLETRADHLFEVIVSAILTDHAG